jgi:hypothetical protein
MPQQGADNPPPVAALADLVARHHDELSRAEDESREHATAAAI